MCSCHGITAVVLFPSHYINKILKRKGSELNSLPVKYFFMNQCKVMCMVGRGGSVDAPKITHEWELS